jgi:tRNA-dihydrouridine synthase A
VLNGGLVDRDSALAELEHVDGVMLGRAAYQLPWLVAELDRALFGGDAAPTLDRVLERYLVYIERELATGTPLRTMTRHLLGLRGGLPGGRRWRRALSELPDGRIGFARLGEIAAQTGAHRDGTRLGAAYAFA